MVSWEKSPKKEVAYPKMEIDTERLQKTTKVRHRLQKITDTLIGKSCSVCFLRLQMIVVFTF